MGMSADMRFFLLFLGVPTLIVALPSLRRRSIGSFLLGLLLSFFGIVLPLFVFLFSAFLTPEAKNEATAGWIDCFYMGKLALTPLVLWATIAFFQVEIYQVENRQHPLIVFGYFLGAIVSWVSTLMGAHLAFAGSVGASKLWMLAPLYVSVWYSIRAAMLMGSAPFGVDKYLAALGGSLPLWIASIWWSRSVYQSLPDQPPGCFVVTAATRGHEHLVGPFFEISRRGENRTVNRQLLTFWQFEDAWRRHSPKSHSLFRRIYNRIGPVVARRITCAWMADAIYFAIKPVEIAAMFLTRLEWTLFKNQNAREASATGASTNQTKTVS
jgi:hypothetical protein